MQILARYNNKIVGPIINLVKKNMLNTFKFLIPYLKRYRIKYIVGVVFLLFTNIFRMANPKVVQYSIDYLKHHCRLTRNRK